MLDISPTNFPFKKIIIWLPQSTHLEEKGEKLCQLFAQTVSFDMWESEAERLNVVAVPVTRLQTQCAQAKLYDPGPSRPRQLGI